MTPTPSTTRDHADTSAVTAVPAAPSTQAAAHFEALLALETDCWDVHEAMADGAPDFVLLHVNGDRAGFEAGHVPGATYLHHSAITAETVAELLVDRPSDTLFVVYCAGPHCNAADRAAAKLARLGQPVKKMIGGRIGWLDEGFSLVAG